MAQKVEDYAKSLLLNQATCVHSYQNDQAEILKTAMLMDIYLKRGWCNKLCEMPIAKQDGFRYKIHNYACSLLP